MASLARPDKWALSGLDGVIWAPPFPTWLEHPGFWDPAHILHYAIGPLFSVAFLDEGGAEVALRRGPPEPDAWRPDRLLVRWEPVDPARRPRAGDPWITEERRVLPGGIVESTWLLPADFGARFLVAFTAQPSAEIERFVGRSGALTWTRRVQDRKGRALDVRCSLGTGGDEDGRAESFVVPSEGAATPHWALSPFAEGAQASPEPDRADPAEASAWTWGALRLDLRGSPEGTLGSRVAEPREPGTSESNAQTADTRVTVRLSLQPTVRPEASGSPVDWETFWRGFPGFRSGDPHLDRYVDARIFGLGLNRVEGVWPLIRNPAIAEGIEYFHVPITYSAQCHMLEMRWHAGGDEAWGSILNFLDNQKSDGSFHGRLYPNHLTGTDYYHANWGDGVRAVHALHPSRERLARCFAGLSRFADWLRRERDPEGSGMFTVVNHYETGQEYMSRYVTVDPEADVNEWLPVLRLKGIDVTVYAYQLFRALEWMAAELDQPEATGHWREAARTTGDAIRSRMWADDQGLFTDVDGSTGRRTDVKAAVGFYPLLTDLVSPVQVEAMLDHLEDPGTFGTPYPVPSSSVDDPHFSAEGLWKGVRRNCPWNGRVWPMATSHLIEGLIRQWVAGNVRSGELGARLLVRFVRMMFDDGDPARPNCFEHYNPYTGRACYFRGIDDYQHSWVMDLILRGMAGLHVTEEGVTLHPLPHDLDRVATGPVNIRGTEAWAVATPSAVRLASGGAEWGTERGQPLVVSWDQLGHG